MSSRLLPENPDDWPTDPHELLGIDPGADAVQIRRAYTRLIRMYKPENAPEEFRRIRAAYEYLTGESHTLDFLRSWATDRLRIEITNPAEERASSEPDATDPTTDLWQLAITGNLRDAYAGYRSRFEWEPASDRIPLRLYWLLVLEPGLDQERDRHFWLSRALVNSRLNGHINELYRRELETDPATALGGSYQNVLTCDAWLNELRKVGQWRIAAARRAEKHEIALSDLESMRSRLLAHNEISWLAMIVTAYDWFAYSRNAVVLYCEDQQRELKHLELSCDPYFDRLDRTYELLVASIDARLPCSIEKLMRETWANRGSVSPRDVLAAARDIDCNRMTYLLKFNVLTSRSGLPIVALLGNIFGKFCDEILGDESNGPSDDFILDRLEEIIISQDIRNYGKFRSVILEWLLDCTWDTWKLARILQRSRYDSLRECSGFLSTDHSFRVVWMAARIQRG